jgi:hypothetical protein
MALSIAITVRKKSAQRMGQELEPERERGWAVKQGLSFVGREVPDALEVQGNCLL